jgi:hypothetical protein
MFKDLGLTVKMAILPKAIYRLTAIKIMTQVHAWYVVNDKWTLAKKKIQDTGNTLYRPKEGKQTNKKAQTSMLGHFWSILLDYSDYICSI